MTVEIMAASGGGGDNFLIPNATFFVELAIFLAVLFVIWRYAVPPIKKMMQERQDMVRKQIEESQEASERLKAAEAKYDEALAEARTEAAKIREGARADAQAIKEEMREQAQQEVARIQQRGEEQLAAQREQTVRELRSEVGQLAVTLAGRIVGESVADDAHRAGTVDRFLDELDGMSATEPDASVPSGQGKS